MSVSSLLSVPLAGQFDDDASPQPAATVAFLEGPAVASDGTVFFSDIWNNRIYRLTPGSTRPEIWREPSGRANGLLFDPQGRLLVCEGNEHSLNDGGRRLTRLDVSTGACTVLCDQWSGRRLNAPNDVACTSSGHIYFSRSRTFSVPTASISHPTSRRCTWWTPARFPGETERSGHSSSIHPDSRTSSDSCSTSPPGGAATA
jgi:gluconolactonase